MILVIAEQASRDEVEDLRQRLRSAGLESTLSEGETRNVVVVLGDTREIKVEDLVKGHPAVAQSVPILPQRRYERVFSRRSFLDVTIAVSTGLLALVTGVVSFLFLSRSGEERRQRNIVRVGKVTDFDRRTYRLVDHDGAPIIVIRSAGGDYHALSAICTHSEVCQVGWSSERQELQCPCHRAAFDLFGNVLHGPPPRPLRSYSVDVVEDAVYLKVRG